MMATSTEAQQSRPWRQVVVGTGTALTLGVVVGLGGWQMGLHGHTSSRMARVATAPVAPPQPTPQPAVAAAAPEPATPAAGALLTILFTDTDAQAAALQSTPNACQTPAPPPPCTGAVPLVLALGPTDLADPHPWLPPQHGQVITAIDLRAAASATLPPAPADLATYLLHAWPPPWGVAAPASQAPALVPTYYLLDDVAAYEAVAYPYVAATLPSALAFLPAPADAEQCVLGIGAANARRAASGLPPIVVVDDR